MKLQRLVWLVAFAVIVAGCSGGDGESGNDDTTTTVAAAAKTTTTSSAEASSGAVDNLEDVRGAIVRIVAEGSFVDPEFGQQYNAAGSGSGFFIDAEGIAVTNNHVVTGAAFLQVYVDGEDQPRNARVLGVSECSDLAVIDVDGDGYPFLEWYDGDIAVGTEIYAAGFPLGDEEFTLLDGIISKENADGESDWASVDSVIEHSADTLPGSSGGPIVTSEGAVVAVNYAGDSAGQSFGIGRDEVLKVLPRLMDGENVTSLGINGQAISDGAFSGIWVSSVASGSAADLGGIEGGDLITLIEGLIPATDGTMADYCDILRSHDEDDPISVEIYRAAEDAFFAGTLNTGQALELSYSFVDELGDEVEDDGATVGYSSYTTLVDSEGVLTVDVPTAWNDVDTVSFWGDGVTTFGVGIWAASDLVAWETQWDTPGVFFGASATLAATETVTSLLDAHDFSGACQYDGRYDYSDGLYTGAYDLWTACEGTETIFVDLAAETSGGEVLMNVQVVAVTDADLEALDTVLNTFVVDEAALAGVVAASDGGGTSEEALGVFPLENLWDGECFNASEASFADTTYGIDVEVVSCDEPHEAEIYGNNFLTESEFPGVDEVAQLADDYCSAEFETYVGRDYASSSLDYWVYYPIETGWDTGITWTMCALVDFNGEPLVGSAYQSGW